MYFKAQDVLDDFSYGIYVVSVKEGGNNNAMIASWVTQCSHDPMLVAVAIRHNRLSHGQLLRSGSFSVGVIPRESDELVKRFKIPDWQNKFAGMHTILTESGLLMPAQIIGYLDLEIVKTIETGDHTLFIGKVIYGKLVNTLEPMTTKDYGGCYRGSS